MTRAWTRETPIGVLTLTEEAGVLTGVLFGPDAPEGALRMETPLIRRAFAQMEEYFRGERKAFDLPMDARGTPFQRRCWRALLEIPYGQTRTYAQQAQAVGQSARVSRRGNGQSRKSAARFDPLPSRGGGGREPDRLRGRAQDQTKAA